VCTFFSPDCFSEEDDNSNVPATLEDDPLNGSGSSGDGDASQAGEPPPHRHHSPKFEHSLNKSTAFHLGRRDLTPSVST
jgi:hypothetical protein